ncbi:hypothetical protein EV143_104391 [Flavobacterium chryseum]|uniref:S24 family peptidase n=1 Tax=Flavobacterium sp. P3160 TaxID=2512113 RepID=UPI0010618DBE|nr:XRE family transcriptional regulator [Flavobacterium sp. P3160]TDO77624.1 hypothetical protein EV143_104391 [Flavobacterium sp. P3160]
MELTKIVETIKKSGVTAYEIAKTEPLTEVGINKILNGSSTNPRKSTLMILENYITKYITKEQHNIKQLLKTDDSFNESITNKNGNTFKELENGKFIMTVPLVPAKAYATYISDCCDGDFVDGFNEVNFYVDQYARGNYVAFEIKGDSMDNGGLYDNPEGCITLCRELGRQHWKDGFRDSQYGWIIVHKDTIVCKDIIGQDLEKGIITCHSRNTSPEYQDFNIELNDVKQIFKIIKRTF